MIHPHLFLCLAVQCYSSAFPAAEKVYCPVFRSLFCSMQFSPTNSRLSILPCIQMFILQCTVLPFQWYTKYIALYSNVYFAGYSFTFLTVDTVYCPGFKCLFCSIQSDFPAVDKVYCPTFKRSFYSVRFSFSSSRQSVLPCIQMFILQCMVQPFQQ